MLKGKQFDFVGNRKKAFILVIALLVVILVGTFVLSPDLSIKFRGGTILSYGYTGDISETEVEGLVQEVTGINANVTKKSSLMGDVQQMFDITLVSSEGLASDVQMELDEKLTTTFADNKLEQLSTTSVAPTVGREFFLKCLIAIVFAAVVMILYIAIRFKKISGWSAGVTAVVALINDMIMVYGCFLLFGMSIDDNFIAVLLTVLGYSVNDTIVVYDRIRENNQYYAKTKSIREIVNISINQTLKRTINTSITTIVAMLIVAIMAYLNGVTSILSFAIPMVVGLVAGTFSSIFVATNLWVMWKEHKIKKHGTM